MKPTVGSLFSGIGGLDLGLERAGWDVRWQSEIDPYASRVLAKHWPDIPNLGDVTAIDWSDVERVDLICGGYPCQPFSSNGNRRGAEDERHLWPFFRDALRALRPRFALLENVPGHLSLGFDVVLGDLAELGFDAEWSIVSACAFGAPHSRERLFVLAYPEGYRWGGQRNEGDAAALRSAGPDDRKPEGSSAPAHWVSVSLTSPIGMAHGAPTAVDRARLKAHGNAVVPQVAEFIGGQLLAALFLSQQSERLLSE